MTALALVAPLETVEEEVESVALVAMVHAPDTALHDLRLDGDPTCVAEGRPVHT